MSQVDNIRAEVKRIADNSLREIVAGVDKGITKFFVKKHNKKKKCTCEYCRLRGDYINKKLIRHRYKKHIENSAYPMLSAGELDEYMDYIHILSRDIILAKQHKDNVINNL